MKHRFILRFIYWLGAKANDLQYVNFVEYF